MNLKLKEEQRQTMGYITKVFTFITILLIILGIFVTMHMLELAENFGESYMESTAKQTASNIRGRIRSDFQILRSVSKKMNKEVESFSEKDVSDFLVKTVASNSNEYQMMSFTYPDGRNIRAQVQNGIVSSNPDTKNYRCFHRALTGRTCFQDSYKEPMAKSGMVNRYYTPVYSGSNESDNNIVGVLGVMLDSDLFVKILDYSNLGQKAFTHVIDAEGDYIVKSQNEKNHSSNYFDQIKKLKDTTQEALCKALESDINGTFWYKNKDGKSYLAAYADIGDGVSIISDIPKDSILLNFNKFLVALLIIIVVFSALLLYHLIYTEKTYKENEETLYNMAFVDDVTEKNNKAKFVIEAKTILSVKFSENFAMMSIDITKFKVINELYGFKRSNLILKEICDILERHLPEDSMCARDFAATYIVLLKYNEESEIVDFVNKVVKDVEQYNSDVMSNMIANSSSGVVSKLVLCFGIYTIKDKALPINIMCDRASIAKREIRNDALRVYNFYDDGLRSKILQDKAIEDEMNIALEGNQFNMFLQPKFDLKTLHLSGAEALVRWVHPQKGIIPPMNFIPVFENNGFIVELDKCIWRQACQFLADRKKNNLKLFPISVNVSRLHLNNDLFIDNLHKLTQEYDVDPKYLELEVTESACIENTSRFSEIIYKLKSLGFRISMDDFGVGYSSLNMLRTLPVDILKLDRGFITDIIGTEDKKGEIVIKNILKMANELGIQTVGEGVETLEQAEFLRDNGCDLVQGFLYGKPVNIETFERTFLNDDSKIVNH